MLPERDLARLRVAIQAGSGLIVVRADTVAERRDMVAWLVGEFAGARLLTLAPDLDPIDALLRQPRVGLLVMYGDEVLVGDARTRWFQALNTGRDRLSTLSAPVVLLADQRLLVELAQQAPDFWSWRVGVWERAEAEVQTPAALDEPLGVATTLEDAWVALGSRSKSYFVDLGVQGWGACVRQVHGRWRIRKNGLYVVGTSPGLGTRSAMERLGEMLDETGGALRIDVWIPSGNVDHAWAAETALLIALSQGIERVGTPPSMPALQVDERSRAALERADYAALWPPSTTLRLTELVRRLHQLDAHSRRQYRHGLFIRILGTGMAGRVLRELLGALSGLSGLILAGQSEVPRLLAGFGAEYLHSIEPFNLASSDGVELLRRVLLTRMSPTLTSPAAERLLLALSGGVVGTLLALAKESLEEAGVSDSPFLREGDVERAAAARVNRLRMQFDDAAWESLRELLPSDGQVLEAERYLARGWILPTVGGPPDHWTLVPLVRRALES